MSGYKYVVLYRALSFDHSVRGTLCREEFTDAPTAMAVRNKYRLQGCEAWVEVEEAT